MTGRVAIVTGANSGIGYHIARYLCEGGNDVVLACRDEDKGQEAVRMIKEEFPNALASFMMLDLSSTHSVRSFVELFCTKKRKLHILVNNAGMKLDPNDPALKPTQEKCEVTMATNFLGPFLLTNLLVEYLRAAGQFTGDARIINITCNEHDLEKGGRAARDATFLDVKNFQLNKEGTYSATQAYKNAKLCMVLFTYQLAEKLRGSYVTVNAVNPGVCPTTRLNRHGNQVKERFNICCLHHILRPAKLTKKARKAGEEIASLAMSDKYQGKNGKYFENGVEERSSVESYDIDLQQEVWKIAEKLTGLRVDQDFDDISLQPDETDELVGPKV